MKVFMDFLNKYNINIKNTKLLEEALTHSSYSNEHKVPDYERLEFLGDAVLQLLTSEYLIKNTNSPEGIMSRERAEYVCEDALAYYAKNIGLDKYIKVGHGMENKINNTIIADVFESLLAVIYLDCGLDACKNFIDLTVIPNIKMNKIFFSDFKSRLQELVQTDKKGLEYVLVSATGLSHDMTFKVNVLVDGIILGTGVGKSKKEAEQNAAKEALEKSAK